MKNSVLAAIAIFAIIVMSVSGTLAQDGPSIAAQEAAIAAKVNANTNDMPEVVRRAHLQNLYRAYTEYVTALDIVIDTGRLASNERDSYVEKRRVAAMYAAILAENLGLSGNAVPPPERDPERADTANRRTRNPQFVPAVDPAGTPAQAISVDTSTNRFPDASKVVAGKAGQIADNAIEALGDSEDVSERVKPIYNELLGFVVAQALLGENGTSNDVLALDSLRYLPETARTDKQIGTSAANSASTSLVNKPGFASILGFAVENGFVEQNVQDSVLTLSTSPVAIFSIGEADRAKAYENAGFLRRVGLSASFNVNSENPLFANATRSQLREFGVRINLFGDHSSRSKGMQKIWDHSIAPKLRNLLLAEGEIREIVDADGYVNGLQRTSRDKFAASIKARMQQADFTAMSSAQQKAELTIFALNFVRAEVYDVVKADPARIGNGTVVSLSTAIKGVLAAQKGYVFDEINQEIAGFLSEPSGTFSYTNHRDPLGNYSQLQLIIDRDVKPMKLTVNAGLSFYHRPSPLMNQDRIRDFDVAVSLEGKKLFNYVEDGDLSPVTYSFSGRYQRLLENRTLLNRKADLVSGQFAVNFPVFRGFSLPFSVTYSNATELERKQGFRFNLGLKLDTDTLFTMNRLKGLIP